MTKIHRQPKQPKPARVTLAALRELARELGLHLRADRRYDGSLWLCADPDPCNPHFVSIDLPRSAALRIMHAALVAMRKEQK